MLRACGVSDTGRVRKTNEDFLVGDETLGLLVVADGMGGHSAGEVASRLAVEAIHGFIRRSHLDREFSWPYGIDPRLSYDGNRLRTAIHIANRRVFRAAEAHDDYTGMGTTVVAALVEGRHLVVGSAGDSRLYLFGGGCLSRQTEDDTWLATVLARDPNVPADAYEHHPMRHVLTNVLGARDEIRVRVTERDLHPGDLLLLCTDGLHAQVPEEVMAAVLRASHPLDVAAGRLVHEALDRGGRDNVTVLLASCDEAR